MRDIDVYLKLPKFTLETLAYQKKSNLKQVRRKGTT